MEQLPIIINGETCGQLTVRREGAYMLCRGHARWSGELLRLWLYGGAEPVYLGVLQPDGTVRKRYSLSEFGRIRGVLTHCGNQPMERKAEPPKVSDTLWYLQPDGTLRCGTYLAFPADGVRLPRGCGGVRRIIEGREYVIFPG